MKNKKGIVKMPACPCCKGKFTLDCKMTDGGHCGICHSCGAVFALVKYKDELFIKSDKWPADPVWC